MPRNAEVTGKFFVQAASVLGWWAIGLNLQWDLPQRVRRRRSYKQESQVCSGVLQAVRVESEESCGFEYSLNLLPMSVGH